ICGGFVAARPSNGDFAYGLYGSEDDMAIGNLARHLHANICLIIHDCNGSTQPARDNLADP
ncbi:MAG TPA: hypothetical protein VF518_13325, partial [Polyangia bacterium]